MDNSSEYQNIDIIIETINHSITGTLRNCLEPLVNKVKHTDKCYSIILDVLKKMPEYQSLLKENEELKKQLSSYTESDIVNLKINEKTPNNTLQNNNKKIILLNDCECGNILINNKTNNAVSSDFILTGCVVHKDDKLEDNRELQLQDNEEEEEVQLQDDEEEVQLQDDEEEVQLQDDEEEVQLQDNEEEEEVHLQDDEEEELQLQDDEEEEVQLQDDEEEVQLQDNEEEEEIHLQDDEEEELQLQDDEVQLQSDDDDEEEEEEEVQIQDDEVQLQSDDDEEVQQNNLPTNERTVPSLTETTETNPTKEEDKEEEEEDKEEEEEDKEEEEEEEEEELYVIELEIDDKEFKYYTNDDENGDIYEILEDEGIGKQVGVFKNGEPEFYD